MRSPSINPMALIAQRLGNVDSAYRKRNAYLKCEFFFEFRNVPISLEMSL